LRLEALCRFMKARHKQPVKTGAGVLPYALHEGRVLFLFHKTFSGRRAGLLVDFGGGAQAAETAFETAAREFVEETEGLFLAPDLRRASRVGDEYRRQFREMQALLARTQEAHANWWCRRHVQPGKQPERLWKRVRELETAPDVIITIRQVLEARGQPG
jgi:hypothetical protein